MARHTKRMTSEPAELRATGVVSIVMVMNLKRFVVEEEAPFMSAARRYLPGWLRRRVPKHLSSRECFEQVRGSGEYASFLRTLRPTRWFEIDQEEARVELHGHELSTFRQYLIDTYFFPTYRLTDSQLALTSQALRSAPDLAAQLDGWVFKVRLTRNGLVVVKLERALDGMPLVEISQMILEIQRMPAAEGAGADARVPTQWQLAMDVVARFVEACGDQFVIETPGGTRRRRGTIHLTHTYPRGKLPLHDRHVVYLFSKMTAGDQEIHVQQLKEQHANEVAGLLENAVLVERGSVRYPRYKAQQIAGVLDADTASWEDEICLITSEASLIFYPLAEKATTFMSGSTRTDQKHIYADYWRSIARGIEHVVALKNEVQILERDTTRLLEKIPDITRKAADGYLSSSDQQDILDLATGIATLFKSLPQQRDALVPSSVFRSSYAAHKFKRLMELLGIHEIEHHIETNVQELNAFLAHFNGIQLQQDEQRTNLIFSVLTVVFSVLVVPSFLADLKQIEWVSQSDLDRLPHSFRQLSQWIGAGGMSSSSRLIGVVALIWLGAVILVWLYRIGRHYYRALHK